MHIMAATLPWYFLFSFGREIWSYGAMCPGCPEAFVAVLMISQTLYTANYELQFVSSVK